MVDFSKIQQDVFAFRDERDWSRFHTPKELAAGLAIEAAELKQEFLWKSDPEIQEYLESKKGHRAVSDEIADVVIYAILAAEACGVNLEAAITKKLEKNREKYPVEKAKGSSKKYTELS